MASGERRRNERSSPRSNLVGKKGNENRTPEGNPERESTQPNLTATQETPPTPPTGNGHRKLSGPATLPAVAGEIFERHPKIRRDCSATQVEKKLASILKHKRIPVAESDAYLDRVNRNHAAACLSPGWAKDDGQFAKSLENWLAPTKERYEVEPPKQQAPEAPQYYNMAEERRKREAERAKAIADAERSRA